MANVQDFNVNDTSFLTLAQGGSGSRPGGTGVDTFTSLGTTIWICPTGVTSVTYLVIGGGGGGGSGAVSANNGGGGGGGGFLTGAVAVTPGTQYTVVVGAGGAPDNQGGYSQFTATAGFAIVAVGGGAGGGRSPASVGGFGASGGGGGPAVPRTGGTGTAGQGNNGGDGNPNSPFQGGGGGGAGAVGGSPTGNGGGGSSSTITGGSVIYAGGGGGGADSSAGTGSGGGGNGARPNVIAATQGTDGLGGGGGGGSSQTPGVTFDSITGARGGHGIVILKYTLPVSSPKAGQFRYNTSNNVPEYFTGVGGSGSWKSIKNVYDGSTAERAAPSAEYIKATTGTNTDGVYWINLPTVGPTQVYCLMNSAANGGGWMMAMKATRGTTFNYSSAYWTAINTLNTGNANRNDGDAKFNTFNYYDARDIMALWPDIGTNGGGLGSNPYNCWSWLQNSFYEGLPMRLVNFFNTAGLYNTGNVGTASSYGGYFKGLAKSFSGWAAGIFSSQDAINFYGFNFKNPQNYATRAYVRWGFGWNENGEGNYSSPATLNTGGAVGSDDVSGGIGMDSSFGDYSAGDRINCCQDSTGINRTARVEIYVR